MISYLCCRGIETRLTLVKAPKPQARDEIQIQMDSKPHSLSIQYGSLGKEETPHLLSYCYEPVLAGIQDRTRRSHKIISMKVTSTASGINRYSINAKWEMGGLGVYSMPVLAFRIKAEPSQEGTLGPEICFWLCQMQFPWPWAGLTVCPNLISSGWNEEDRSLFCGSFHL